VSGKAKHFGCKFAGCCGKHQGHGFCDYHRTQFRRGIIDKDGNVLRERLKIPSNGRCKIEGCRREHNSHGFCATHDYQFGMGITDKDGKQLKPLFDSMRSKIGATQYERGKYHILQRYFGGGPLCRCKMCGEEFEFYQIDGHHPDKSKKEMNTSLMTRYAFLNHPEMLAELDSIEWLCCHCHIIVHAGGEDTPYSQTNIHGKHMDRQMVEILKITGNRCVDCGRPLGRRTIVFHHKDPLQKTDCISQILGKYKIGFIMEEVGKCDILCQPCHRKRHWLNKKMRGNLQDRERMLSISPINKRRHDGKQGCRVVGCVSKHFGRGFCKKHLYHFSVGILNENGEQLRPLYQRAS